MTQIRTRKKVAILGLFALGIFITVVQVIRFHSIQTLSNLLDSAHAITWSVIEGNLGVITTCLPTLAPLIKYFSERTRTGQSGKKSSRGIIGSGNTTPGHPGYALKSLDRTIRRTGQVAELSVEVHGNQSSDTMALIHDNSGIMKKTEVTQTSSATSWRG